MMRKIYPFLFLVFLLTTVSGLAEKSRREFKDSRYKVLIINVQNKHNWKIGSDAFKKILEGSELISVDVATSPEKGGDMDAFKPDFSAYVLIVLDYYGTEWSVSGKVKQIIPAEYPDKENVILWEDNKQPPQEKK
jgi:hypothetical protein